ncbi:MAG: carboxypeptidase-like regulatory domain-containing protein [Granulosicoccus sp.]
MKSKISFRDWFGSVVVSGAMCSAIAAAMLVSSPANAGKFGVRVVDDSGDPVAGASVCVGLPGNYKQFGALFTDADGQAITEVPNIPFVVTVSKTRFSGTRMAEPARGYNLIKQVTLSEGVPGPRCRAGSTLASANPPSVVIGDVSVNEGTFSTTLKPVVSGEPDHYRVSTSAEFSDANWQKFDSSIALSSALSDEARVFLQLRRFEGSSSGWVEARSRVVTVQLPIAQ